MLNLGYNAQFQRHAMLKVAYFAGFSLEVDYNMHKTAADHTSKHFKYGFMLLIALLAGLILAVPDGLTYAHYAALNGQVIDRSWHISWAGWWLGYGAPLGVYIFAFNNIYRFCVLVLQDLSRYRDYIWSQQRYIGFACIILLAIVSIIPFYGMARAAHLNAFFAWSNAFARFCMNVFAFFVVFNLIIDNLVLRASSRRQVLLLRVQQLRYLLITGQMNAPVSSIGEWSHVRVTMLLHRNLAKQFQLSRVRTSLLRVVAWVMFMCGAITGIYLYHFAYTAAQGITQNLVVTIGLAVAAIIPTCVLWGHDASFSWKVPLRFVLRSGLLPASWLRAMHYDVPVKLLFLVLMLCGVLFIGVPSTLSESMMAIEYTRGHVIGPLLQVVVGPAFIGIYLTGLIELLSRICHALQKKIYPQSEHTRRLICLEQLDLLALRVMRQKRIKH